MLKICLKLVLATSFITLFGCSAMNPKAIESVQTVAFVGFDVDTNATSFPRSSDGVPLARKMQDSVKQSFSQKLGWNITSGQSVTQNPIYRNFFKEYKSMFIRGGLVETGQLRKVEADRLDFQERELLMSALNVDAIAMIRLTMPTRVVQNSNGKISKYYDVMVNFDLYKKGNEDSIWKTNTTKGSSEIALEYVAKAQTTKASSAPDLTDTIKSMDVNGLLGAIQASEDQNSLSAHESSLDIKAKKQQIFEDAMSIALNQLISEYQNTPKESAQ